MGRVHASQLSQRGMLFDALLEEESTRQLLECYLKLVDLIAIDVANEGDADTLIDMVDGMSEEQAKSMLIARMASEAAAANDAADAVSNRFPRTTYAPHPSSILH